MNYDCVEGRWVGGKAVGKVGGQWVEKRLLSGAAWRKREIFKRVHGLDEWPTKRCSKVVEQIVLLKPILAYATNRSEQTGEIEEYWGKTDRLCGANQGGELLF